jgi:hypothetical protein
MISLSLNVNVTSSGNEIYGSESAELADLFGGLILNSSGNYTGNILGVTTALGTLGLPLNVRSALANLSLPNSGAYSRPEYYNPPPPPPPPPWEDGLGGAVWNTISGIAEATGITKLVSVVWNGIEVAQDYINLAESRLHSGPLGLGSLRNQLASGLRTLDSSMAWALNLLIQSIKVELNALLSPVIDPILRAAQGEVSFIGYWSNESVSQWETLGQVTQTVGIAWMHSTDGPAEVATAIAFAIVVALAILLPFDLSSNILMDVVLTIVPTLAEAFISSLRDLTGFSSQAILALDSLWSGNGIPGGSWEGLAGAIGFGAASVDLVAQEIWLGLKGGVSGGAAVAMITAFVCDWIVIEISIFNWAVHSANLVLVALIFAAVGWAVTLYALRQRYADLAEYDNWAFLMATVGVAAAAADYYLYVT